MEGLGDLPGGSFASGAHAVSADGRIVVGSGRSAIGIDGFVWDAENGMRQLAHLLEEEYGADLGGLALRWADDVSADGRVVVGTAQDAAGNQQAWRAELAPLCGNGIDDDGDGTADFPGDPGCASQGDWSERGLGLPCDDGQDGDGDARADAPQDPGCAGPFDSDEKGAELACDDGLDDDGDALSDFPADPGCASPSSPSEAPACNDGTDDDGDGRADLADPGCEAPSDLSEKSPFYSCDDTLDNDGDGLVDFPADPGCAGPASDEAPPCSNGWDDDGDGLTDVGQDPGCRSPADALENPACSNDWDDDGDGRVDWDGGSGGAPPDPECAGAPWRQRESKGCGLGFELGPILTLLAWRRRPARRRVCVP